MEQANADSNAESSPGALAGGDPNISFMEGPEILSPGKIGMGAERARPVDFRYETLTSPS